ncbi:Sterol 3-beta-glucosyltransferase [Rhizoctonia solani AG-1 IB]|uniref:Sterol 3-beta-glucosyltransferase n=1 Tax=Thanatephorus cucumeris (strain AG1-IB / isolate 7/3/14) TaxID=1108050 RepID=M5C555_THACB|nr:Sterol 3-beta-glucosyltransferase [Rhizoctonia solani AG-1 IB]
MQPNQRDSSYAPSRGSQRYNSDHDLPVPSSAPGSVYNSPNTPSRSFESLAQATIQPPPPPLYTRYDYGSQAGPSAPRPSMHSYSSSSKASQISALEKDHPTLPGYTQLDTKTVVSEDGRLNISFGNRMSKALPESYGAPVHEEGIDETGFRSAPRMNINIMIVGSRGDVQPYLALGKQLQQYGHNVRLSTHETFRKMVKDAGLRFYNIGGDPHELMSYMVRNPGLIPGIESLKNGDIGKKQKMVGEILEGCFASCFAPDYGSGEDTGFAADAIISNPPTFAHIHCAEALGIPLLLSFTMPWCPTASSPHPLVNIKQSGSTEPRMANYYSYGLVDLMTWQGLGRTINKFRMKRLGLEYLSTTSAVGMLERCAVPWTYCLSPALVPKPSDWMSHIDVVGFYFLDLASDYAPPANLIEFLKSGEPPVYIGFGSIVLQSPQEMTKAILAGIAQAGVRAIISPGWGGLDEDLIRSAGPHVFALGNVPHDWLFQHVSAVCHHGGAGTTAIGLRCGKPTIILPFFGDQPWWAVQIARRGAGPPPLDSKSLTAAGFAAALRMALSPATLESAQVVGAMIRQENGAQNGVDSFHRHMPLLNMRCDLDSTRVAVWYSPTHNMRMSAFAAQVLSESGYIDINQLKLHRSREYVTQIDAFDPVSGTLSPAMKLLGDFGRGVSKLPTRPDKGMAQIVAAGTFGATSTLKGTADGFANLPKLYGGQVRERKKVNGVGSGLVEGTKVCISPSESV